MTTQTRRGNKPLLLDLGYVYTGECVVCRRDVLTKYDSHGRENLFCGNGCDNFLMDALVSDPDLGALMRGLLEDFRIKRQT